MKPVRAAGGVLWRSREGGHAETGVEVALVHRPRYDDWSLPKGKQERGELDLACAVREVAEETGSSCVAGRGLGVSRYRVLEGGHEVPKTVRWWALRATGGEFAPCEEVDALRWLPVDQALRAVTAGHDDAVLERFAEWPPTTSTVLLVRHARAGSRDQWEGPDGVRPLDDGGRAQAEALAGLLPLWAPVEVLTSPADRCRQTVAPAERSLGLVAQVDEELAESSPTLPKRLRELGQLGRTVVACSQGGARIGAAVTELAEEVGLAVADARAPKGSVWALSFVDGRLVDVDRSDVPV